MDSSLICCFRALMFKNSKKLDSHIVSEHGESNPSRRKRARKAQAGPSGKKKTPRRSRKEIVLSGTPSNNCSIDAEMSLVPSLMTSVHTFIAVLWHPQ